MPRIFSNRYLNFESDTQSKKSIELGVVIDDKPFYNVAFRQIEEGREQKLVFF